MMKVMETYTCYVKINHKVRSAARIYIKKISIKKIVNSSKQINNFYTSKIQKKPKIAVLGLNPHCETVDKFSEEDKIIKPAIAIRPFHISACGVNPLFQELISLGLAGLMDLLDSLPCFKVIIKKLIA